MTSSFRLLLWKAYLIRNKIYYQLLPKRKNAAIVFDTSINTLNLGDDIINLYCNKILSECIGGREIKHISTHVVPDKDELEEIKHTKLKIVCGTNILSPDYVKWTLWKMPRHLNGYHDVIALGIGWGYYSKSFTEKTKIVYRYIFGKHGIHSVRDSYTENKMKMMGIKNVLNTGCPTMWNLTPEFCKGIPSEKARRVVTTLTDYSRNIDADNYMLEVLSKEYEMVFLWPQGSDDTEYYKELEHFDNVVLLPRDLEEYTRLLQSGDLDYVGTRLHGGIHALNYKVRSLIIAVDHRAVEIGKDFSVPYIKRNEIKEKLITEINANRKTCIQIPIDNIQKWKAQFN